MDGLQLATLDTLHYRLARDAKGLGRVLHWEPTWRCLFNELGAELVGETDLPGRAGSELLAADEAVEEPTQQGRLGNAHDLGGASDRHDFTGWRRSRWLVARDVAIPAEAADHIGRKALVSGAAATLTIEDAGNDRVGIVIRQAAQ